MTLPNELVSAWPVQSIINLLPDKQTVMVACISAMHELIRECLWAESEMKALLSIWGSEKEQGWLERTQLNKEAYLYNII